MNSNFVLVGIDAILCEVEVDVSKHGPEKTTIVGLAQAAVRESIKRVRRAMINSGFPFPANPQLINFAQAVAFSNEQLLAELYE